MVITLLASFKITTIILAITIKTKKKRKNFMDLLVTLLYLSSLPEQSKKNYTRFYKVRREGRGEREDRTSQKKDMKLGIFNSKYTFIKAQLSQHKKKNNTFR